MADKLVEFLGRLIDNKYLLTAVLSVLPVTEIKGAVLFAAVSNIDPIIAFLCCVGATVALSACLSAICPMLIRLAEKIPPVKKLTDFLTDRVKETAAKIELKAVKNGDAGERQKLLGVFAFVAVPLPLTGVWAGATLAAILHLDFKSSLFALATGNFVAGGVVLFIALAAGERASLVLNVFLLVALAALMFAIAKWALSKLTEIKKPRNHRGF